MIETLDYNCQKQIHLPTDSRPSPSSRYPYFFFQESAAG